MPQRRRKALTHASRQHGPKSASRETIARTDNHGSDMSQTTARDKGFGMRSRDESPANRLQPEGQDSEDEWDDESEARHTWIDRSSGRRQLSLTLEKRIRTMFPQSFGNKQTSESAMQSEESEKAADER